jgi:hypothetical protein
VLVAQHPAEYLATWEDCGSRPAWENSTRDPISKTTRPK